MINLGLIGRGPWSRKIAATLDILEAVTWTPVKKPSDNPALDGVIIANKSCEHAKTAIDFLEAGIACFIEKPVAVSLSEFNLMLQASQKSSAVAFAGHIHLFNPAIETFLSSMPEIGSVISATGKFCNSNPRSDTSVIWDWLPHPLSIGTRLFQKTCTLVTARSLAEKDNNAYAVHAIIMYERVQFEFTTSWMSPQSQMEIIVQGESGKITFDDKSNKKVSLSKNSIVSYPAIAAGSPLLIELQAFVDTLRGERSNPSPLDTAEPIILILDAIERSVLSGGKAQTINRMC